MLKNTYLSTQWAAVIAQFSFNKAAPHLCRYVDVLHCLSEICQGHRPNDAFEPPTIRGSGYIRLPHTAITIKVEFSTLESIFFLNKVFLYKKYINQNNCLYSKVTPPKTFSFNRLNLSLLRIRNNSSLCSYFIKTTNKSLSVCKIFFQYERNTR